MFKLLGMLVWAIIIIVVWSHWPAVPAVPAVLAKDEVAISLTGRDVDIALLVGMIVALLTNVIVLVAYGLLIRVLKRRQDKTERFLDDLAEIWLDGHDPGGGEPVLHIEKVVPIRRKA